jgi:hypothetical protein
MKRILSVFFLFSIFTQVGRAQGTTAPVPAATANPAVIYPDDFPKYDDHFRFLLGVSGGTSFGNAFLSTSAGVEVPFAKRFEIDLGDAFSPYEEHIALGKGWANAANASGIVWVTPGKSLGINGGAEYSNYSVSIYKGSYYAMAGLTWRHTGFGLPTRFSFDYFRQFDNGISSNGTETDHLQGGEFTVTVRMGAVGPTVARMAFSTSVGHLLTQGDQACDGSLGVYIPSCKRGQAVSGGATVGVNFEFPRHRGEEDSLF